MLQKLREHRAGSYVRRATEAVRTAECDQRCSRRAVWRRDGRRSVRIVAPRRTLHMAADDLATRLYPLRQRDDRRRLVGRRAAPGVVSRDDRRLAASPAAAHRLRRLGPVARPIGAHGVRRPGADGDGGKRLGAPLGELRGKLPDRPGRSRTGAPSPACRAAGRRRGTRRGSSRPRSRRDTRSRTVPG